MIDSCRSGPDAARRDSKLRIAATAIETERRPLHIHFVPTRCHPVGMEAEPVRLAELLAALSLAGSHHERLNGTGYHRGLRAAGLDELARILAAADAYATLREQRPSRAAYNSAETVQQLQAEVDSAALDASAVRAVITAAKEEPPAAVHWPRPLSDREVEVLRLAVRGLTTRQVGNRLGIAPKPVDRHLQNCYAKIGVSSRAGAALFALEHGLL